MSKLNKFSFLLTIIGALNWGFVGLFEFNLVEVLFGEMTFLTRIIYILVGIGGIFGLLNLKKCCKNIE
jgi:uncharacterized membrane protein YuzA (DUF378 family)